MSARLEEIADVDLHNSSEESLIAAARCGDEDAFREMMQRYFTFIRRQAKPYFILGAERDDLLQEGMIGFFKSIRCYQQERTTSFHAFAEMCIQRQIITAVKRANRKKHVPLNSYLSLDQPLYEEEESQRTLLDVLAVTDRIDPEEILIGEEQAAEMEEAMSTLLSDLERAVLVRYLDGESYQEIAADLDRQVKSIDNALQRVKQKIFQYLSNRRETS